MGAAMAEEPDTTFESTESGASLTYPQQAGEIRKGSHLMIKGFACKCVEVSTSKTGKHGHAKAHIVAIDIFSGKKYEDLCPTSHNLEVPFVKKIEYQVLTADEDGSVSLLKPDDSGETKDDLFLPDRTMQFGEPGDDEKKTAKEILDGLEAGKTTTAIVLCA